MVQIGNEINHGMIWPMAISIISTSRNWFTRHTGRKGGDISIPIMLHIAGGKTMNQDFSRQYDYARCPLM
jgi:arabinogalactan endo-1,4-beta-galactosidase